MRFARKLLIIILITISLTISGCLGIYFDVHINSDGSGRIEIIHNYTKFFESLKEFEDYDEEDINLDAVCENFYEGMNETPELKNYNCEVIDQKIIISVDVPKGEFNVELHEDGTYSFRLNKESPIFEILQVPEEYEEIEEDIESEEDLFPDIDMNFDKMFDIIYTLQFEGEVIESNIGEIDGNKVIINLLKEPTAKVEEAVIKARRSEITNQTTNKISTNNKPYIILGGIILTLTIFAFLLFRANNNQTDPYETFRKTNQNPLQPTQETNENMNQSIKQSTNYYTNEQQPNMQYSNNQENQYEPQTTMQTHQMNTTNELQNQQEQYQEELNPKVQNLIKWIYRYENQYPQNVLRDELNKNPNYTQEEIDQAFRYK
jgi:hypothetical protein